MQLELEFQRSGRLDSSNHSNGWGRANPGQWMPGTYRVELFVEGKKIVEDSFEIVGDGGGGKDTVVPQSFDIPSIQAKVTAMNLYEGPREGTPRDQRVYTRTFARSTTRYVYWELNLKFPKPGVRKNFQIDVIYYKGEGNVFGTQSTNSYIEPGWTTSYHNFGRGWVNPGNWPPGGYQDRSLRGRPRGGLADFHHRRPLTWAIHPLFNIHALKCSSPPKFVIPQNLNIHQ